MVLSYDVGDGNRLVKGSCNRREECLPTCVNARTCMLPIQGGSNVTMAACSSKLRH